MCLHFEFIFKYTQLGKYIKNNDVTDSLVWREAWARWMRNRMELKLHVFYICITCI